MLDMRILALVTAIIIYFKILGMTLCYSSLRCYKMTLYYIYYTATTKNMTSNKNIYTKLFLMN